MSDGDSKVYEEQLVNRLTTETEREYLEKFIFDWNMILSKNFQSHLHQFRNKLTKLKEGKDNGPFRDLGTEFNDFRLNMRVKDPKGEADKDVFSATMVDGNLQFRCEICEISVLGKKNIESHMEGKRHRGKLEEFTAVGKIFSKLYL